jgi:hypothetical protein
VALMAQKFIGVVDEDEPELIVPKRDWKDEIGGWSSQISMLDRERLRAIVRKVHLRHYPTEMLTNRTCDALIDAWGPVTGEIVIKKALAARGGFGL